MYSWGMNELCPVAGSVVLSFQQLLNISARRRFLFVIIHILWALHLYILPGVPHRNITNKKRRLYAIAAREAYRLVTSDVFQSDAYIKGFISTRVAATNLFDQLLYVGMCVCCLYADSSSVFSFRSPLKEINQI